MKLRGIVLRVVAVVTVALAAGHLAQFLRADAPLAELQSTPHTTVILASDDLSVPKSASLDSGLSGAEPALTGITSVAADLAPVDACATTLHLAPAPYAMIDLALTAPCNAGERIVVRHAGLSFTARTDQTGAATLQLPALQTDAVVTVYLTKSAIALARITIPEADLQRRFVFQWSSGESFTLRAIEGGQGDDLAGKILSLGLASVQDPLLAQVYTYPPGDSQAVDLAVELRVAQTICGQTLAAQTLTSARGQVHLTEFPVAMPLCGSPGDILVLKNLAPDLTLATPN